MNSPGPLAIIGFSPFVPHAEIDHAGGEILRGYCRATSHLGNRLLVAPADDKNLNRRWTDVDAVHLVTPFVTLPDRARDGVSRRLGVPHWKPSLSHSLQRDAFVLDALKRADVVEYHWYETTVLLEWARRHAPEARHVIFLHDVVSQRIQRGVPTGGWWGPIRAQALHRWTRRAERRVAQRADAIIVLSRKDALLLPSHAPVIVAPPSVAVTTRPRAEPRPGQAPVFIFVAAFHRPENVEAAVWLAEEVWPRIRARREDAELRFVGQGSESKLSELLDPATGIGATGYVDDLGAEYQNASVALVPLQRGAGVKIKTLEAMATATPCVSTSVGAEGIERAREFVDIADSPPQFADAAVRLADDPNGLATRRAEAGATWVATAHAPSALTEIYTGALIGADQRRQRVTAAEPR